jgi:hypothetical protein
MVLDEVDLDRFAVLPLECDPPRSIDIHSPSHRLGAAIRMKPQAGQPKIIQSFGPVNGIENLNAPLPQIGPDAATFPGFEQLLNALIGKGSNHRSPLTHVPARRCRHHRQTVKYGFPPVKSRFTFDFVL